MIRLGLNDANHKQGFCSNRLQALRRFFCLRGFYGQFIFKLGRSCRSGRQASRVVSQGSLPYRQLMKHASSALRSAVSSMNTTFYITTYCFTMELIRIKQNKMENIGLPFAAKLRQAASPA